ncbi:M24 family metallopeptidase [uncultured Rubinisphaera sp.]|uniref:M24 family metallopeptidase n=1 Tax=uncultured Rubinisphaera sp. TaxID=1678686 RepID=UPI0030DDC35A
MSSVDLVAQLQHAITEAGLSGWLFYDFRGTNPLARSVLGLTENHAGSRRWFYFVPANGEPVRIVHGIETEALDSLTGQKKIYRSWRELHDILHHTLSTVPTLAMEYAPDASNPYISRVDAGTIELIRKCGPEVVSSGDLIQHFDACLSESQWQMHLEATEVTTSAFTMASKFIADQIAKSGSISELEVCDQIMSYFADHNMTTYSPPIVARQPNNRFPHYETGAGAATSIKPGDLVMIDMWCKGKQQGAIYSDLTRMFYVGEELPEEYAQAFKIVIKARDVGIELVKERMAAGEPLAGWEVDHAVRKVISEAGQDEYFLHRTGHSLGQEVHSNGAHLDDYEMHEERLLIPGALFTIEPGLYLDNFGLRSEVDVFIDRASNVHVTGGPVQTEIEIIG